MLKPGKQKFIGTVILIFSLVFIAGCSPKKAAEKTQPSPEPQTVNNTAPTAQALSQNETAEQFVKNQGYKIYMDSGNCIDIQLPESFAVQRNGIPIGELLKQRHELLKQKGLDFSSYLGKKITLYTYGVESTEVVSEKVDIIMDKNKVVAFWTDTHKEPPDFNVIVGALN